MKDKGICKIWIERINRAKQVRANWKKIFKVDLARAYFEGCQDIGAPSGEWITINKIYSHLMARLPSLYNADPYFFVRLRRSFNPLPQVIEMYEKRGEVRQAMLNYLKEKNKLKEKARLAILDAHFAYGVLKVHYAADLEENPNFGNNVYSEDGGFIYDDSGNPIPELEYTTVNERYAISRVHPDDFLWDEDSGPLDDSWSWVAQQVRIRYEDLKDDPRYSKAAIKALKGVAETKDDDARDREGRKKGLSDYLFAGDTGADGENFVTLWEIYKIKNKTWTVISENCDIPLVDEEPYPPGLCDHPFSVLRFTLRDDSPYPIPVVSQGIDVQKEYNIARSQVLTHRKRFNRKYEVLEAALVDEFEITKLETGEDGTIIRVNAPGAVHAIADAPLDQQRYMEISYLNNDLIELLGGTTDEARGLAGADSATQAGLMAQRLNMREGDALSMVIDFVKEVARKLDYLVQTHITQDEAIRVTGVDGLEYWQLVKTDDYEAIEGEYEYTVNVGATQQQLPQMERASWLAFLQVVGSAPHLLMSRMLIKEVAKMHNIENDALIEELMRIGKVIMGGGQRNNTGAVGDQAYIHRENPVGAIIGQVNGLQGG